MHYSTRSQLSPESWLRIRLRHGSPGLRDFERLSAVDAMGWPEFRRDKLIVRTVDAAAEGAGIMAAAGAEAVVVCQLAAAVRAVTMGRFAHGLGGGRGEGQHGFAPRLFLRFCG